MKASMKNLVTNRLDSILNYLTPFLPFINCHMVDFFTHASYCKYIPAGIRQEIDAEGVENVLESILGGNINEYKCPNLLSFLNETKRYCVENFPEVCWSLQNLQLRLIDVGCSSLSGPRIDSFMSTKKSHEVEVMSQISSAVCEVAKSEVVVDVGDGKGYLSSALALHSHLKVLGIDSSDTNTKNAAKRLSKFTKYWRNNPNMIENTDLYKQATVFVTERTDLTQIVNQFFTAKDFCLVGLHTCGDLASTCLKLFARNACVSACCHVGCCYHLLTEQCGDDAHDSGFPLSGYLKDKAFKIGRNARMLASQSLDRILTNKELPSTILFYRALLQIILVNYHGHLLGKHVGKFHRRDATFLEYVKKCFEKFGAQMNISQAELLSLYEEHLRDEKVLQIFYLIRAHFAPVIESVILLDRLLYLLEQDLEEVYLVKMFDPVISPRCYAIVAFKNKL